MNPFSAELPFSSMLKGTRTLVRRKFKVFHSATMATHKKSSGSSRARRNVAHFPQSLVTYPIRAEKFRYYCTTDQTNTVVNSNGLSTALWMATSTTSGASMFGTVRLVKVEMFGLDDGKTNVFTPISLTLNSSSTIGLVAPQRALTAQGNAMNPAHLSISTDPRTQSGSWFEPAASGIELFTFSCESGCIIDLSIEYTILDSSASLASTYSTATGAVLGSIYSNYLDGMALNKSAGAATIAPQGRPGKQLAV